MEQKSKIIFVNENNNKEVKNYGLGDEVKVELNALAIIPIIADKIYKKATSPIRELYNNEVTACEKALLLNPNLDQRIEIILNTDTRELSIQGFNSLGMDSTTFMKILRVMGNSGNSEGNYKGLFGIGFYSFFKISERIIIISNSLESKEKFAYICKSALKFERLKDENYEGLKETGFKIIVNVKDGINMDQFDEYIRGITKLSGVKTLFIKDGTNIELEQYDNLEHYFKSINSEFFNDPYTSKYSVYYEHYNTEDYEIILYKIAGVKDDRILKECFLLNTPVEYDHNFNYDTGYLINIKDEVSYRPTPDRERLEQKSEDELNSIFGDDKFNLSNLNSDQFTLPKTLLEWYDIPLRHFYHQIGIREGGKYITLSMDVKSLNHTDYNGKHRFDDLSSNMPSKKPKSLGYCNSFRKKKFSDLQSEEEKFCICPKKKSEENYELLESVGFKNIVKKRTRTYNRVTRDYTPRLLSNFKYHFRYNIVTQIDDKTIVLRADDLTSDKNNLSNAPSNVCYVSQYADCETIRKEDLLNDYLDDIFWTNRGLMSLEEILRGMKHRRITEYTDDQLRFKTLMNYKKKGFFIVIQDTKLIELIHFYLQINYSHSLHSLSIKEPYYEEIQELIKDDTLLKIIFGHYSSYNFGTIQFNEWNEIIKRFNEGK